jgi:hypothetical protein
MIRHGVDGLDSSPRSLNTNSPAVREIVNEILERARSIDPEERGVDAEMQRSLDDWVLRNPQFYWNDYRINESLLQSAELAASMRAMGRAAGDAWPTMNNMRSVEPNVRFRLAERLRPHSSPVTSGKTDGQ